MHTLRKESEDVRLSRMPIYTAFYTPEYEQECKKLEKSLKEFGLRFAIYSTHTRGSWDLNTKIKVEIIKHVLTTYNKNVVYIDADAIVQSYPLLLDTLDCDFACHYKGGTELLSGTLFFSPRAMPLVDAWIEENKKQPRVWDQRTLAIVLKQFPNLKKEILPASYCQIFDSMRHNGPAVIEHFQASRRLKAIVSNA